jgi:hypothetical protein
LLRDLATLGFGRVADSAIEFSWRMADAPRRRRILRGIAALFVAAGIYVVAAGWVSNAATADDLQAIARLRADPHCRDRSGFAGQLHCIRHIQAAVLPVGRRLCAAKGETIEPMAFIRRGYGCCFDRARFIEKALRHYGYTTRRVALYEARYGLLGLLIPRIDSHAATEVRTARGWLAVDSEQPFVLITRAGRPLRFVDYHGPAARELAQGPRGVHSFGFARRYYVIYGLYSRHGGFYGPNLPGPDIRYPEFVRYALLGLD